MFLIVVCGRSWAILVGALALIPEERARRAFLVLPELLGGSVLIAGLLSRSYVLSAGGYVLGAFLWSAEYPTMLSVIAEEEPRRFGAATALSAVISAGARFLLVYATGWPVEQVGEAQM